MMQMFRTTKFPSEHDPKERASGAPTAISNGASRFLRTVILVLTASALCYSIYFSLARRVEYSDTQVVERRPDYQSYAGMTRINIAPRRRLKDYNAIHLKVAKRNGLIHSFKTNKAFKKNIDLYVKDGELKRVKSTRLYHVEHLTYSKPYLKPYVFDLLNEIGFRFKLKLKEKHLPPYKYVISSVLRTEENQKALTHVNKNATPNESSHYFGTTFDICYRKFYLSGMHGDDVRVNACLTEVISELRQECKLICVDESSNACYHITATRKR